MIQPFLLALLPSVALSQDNPAESPAITLEEYSHHLQTLSSDAFEGRGPASPGGERTEAYLVQQFERAGLQPGYKGKWFQPVSLLATTPTGKPEAAVTQDGQRRELVFGRDLMIVSKVPDGVVQVEDSELVFVGYGAVAPEYGWDDYAGVDVRGKTVLCMVNDPGYATQDRALFRGNSMTYYGRYTYKFEEAARQGAAACLVIHEEAAAGYPWQVVNRSWGGTSYGLEPDPAAPVLPIEGWITRAATLQLIEEAGGQGEAWLKSAQEPDFRAKPLGTKARLSLTNGTKRSSSNNVVGLVEGRTHPEEAVLFCAHWDHLGRKPGGGKDDIYNGAQDNASGSAGLLELAQAFGALDPAPARSVYFVAFTAEESGLLGSRRFAETPPIPASAFVGGVNMDGLNLFGPMLDLVVVGYGASEMDQLLAQMAAAQGRVLAPEPTPEKGYYYRSDHFNLAKVGVPMLFTAGGRTHREKGAGFVAQLDANYLRRDYHQPSDEFDPAWDLRGAVEDLHIFYALGLRLAQGGEWPRWDPGSEFRAVREASFKKR